MTFVEHVQSLYHRVVLWWRPPPPPPVIERPPAPLERPPFPKPIEPAAGKFDADSGEFYFREAILDQLDYYFTCIRRMKNKDPDAFGLYSRIGGLVMPQSLMLKSDTPLIGHSVSPWFRDTLPDFGAVFHGDTARHYESEKTGKKSLWPRFFYFCKFKARRAPRTIEPTYRGQVYIMTCYWDKPEEKGFKGAPSEFAIAVLPDGSLRLLRQLTVETVKIRHRRGRDRKYVTILDRQIWSRGDWFLRDWASQHKTEAEELAALMFAQASLLFEMAQASVIRVSVNRDDLTAAFSVNIKRTPYFFKDRDLEVNENGRRKRIFHIVRPHVRASGTAVKLHFRGARNFIWNGYRIVITVPGLHHKPLFDMNKGLIDGALGDGMSLPEAGERFRDRIQGSAA